MSSMLVLDLPQDALLPDIFPDDAEQPGGQNIRVLLLLLLATPNTVNLKR